MMQVDELPPALEMDEGTQEVPVPLDDFDLPVPLPMDIQEGDKVLSDTDLVVELIPIQLEDEYNLIKYPKEWFYQFLNPLQITSKKELLDLNFNFLIIKNIY